MRLTLLSFFLLAGLAASAQALRFEEAIVTQVVDPSIDDVAAYVTLLNESDRRYAVRWVREVNDLPGGWMSAVCDTNQCYLPQVDSADFQIAANGSTRIIPHIYPDGTAGEAQMTIRVFEINNRDNDAVVTFNFSWLSPTRNAFYQGPRIFPNPGAEEFEVLSDVPLNSVRLTNMLGTVVREYPAQLRRYDVSDLPNGLYLASLIGVDGRIVKTLRYSKRQVMP